MHWNPSESSRDRLFSNMSVGQYHILKYKPSVPSVPSVPNTQV